MLAELLLQLHEQQADLSNPAAGLTAVLDVSWNSLDESTQQIAMILSLFAPTPIPHAMLEQVVNAELETNIKQETLATACTSLVQRHLLQRIDEATYYLHASIRAHFQTKLNQSTQGNGFKQAFCQTMATFAKQLSDPPPIEECAAFAPAIPHITEAATTWQAWLTNKSIVFPFLCLGRFYAAQGAVEQAAPWYEQCVLAARNHLGEEHPVISVGLTHLANFYYTQSRYQEAEPLYQEALELLKQLLGKEHPAVAIILTNLANLHQIRGQGYQETEHNNAQVLNLGDFYE